MSVLREAKLGLDVEGFGYNRRPSVDFGCLGGIRLNEVNEWCCYSVLVQRFVEEEFLVRNRPCGYFHMAGRQLAKPPKEVEKVRFEKPTVLEKGLLSCWKEGLMKRLKASKGFMEVESNIFQWIKSGCAGTERVRTWTYLYWHSLELQLIPSLDLQEASALLQYINHCSCDRYKHYI